MATKRSASYIKLADPVKEIAHNYRDRDSIPFRVQYPLVEFTDDFIGANAPAAIIRKLVLSNYWYQRSNTLERREIVNRVKRINKNIQVVLNFIDRTYGHLGLSVEHISIAGSYAHSAKPGDIDFNVVLSGSIFDYITFTDGMELLDATGMVNKMSLIVMGMDNIRGSQLISDDIPTDGFIHQDIIMREMLVAPMRNITVYGAPLNRRKNLDNRNVLARIARQLYHAELTLAGKIPRYEEEPLKTKKAAGRIREAYEIIDWLLNESEDLR